MNPESDLSCRMKRCRDCSEWKPETDFYLRRRGLGMGRVSYCRPCMAERWRQRDAKRRRQTDGSESPFAHRLPDDTARDFAENIFTLYPKFQKMALAVSSAPKALQPAIKRELVPMIRAVLGHAA